jgi:hypothetical protein
MSHYIDNECQHIDIGVFFKVFHYIAVRKAYPVMKYPVVRFKAHKHGKYFMDTLVLILQCACGNIIAVVETGFRVCKKKPVCNFSTSSNDFLMKMTETFHNGFIRISPAKIKAVAVKIT